MRLITLGVLCAAVFAAGAAAAQTYVPSDEWLPPGVNSKQPSFAPTGECQGTAMGWRCRWVYTDTGYYEPRSNVPADQTAYRWGPPAYIQPQYYGYWGYDYVQPLRRRPYYYDRYGNCCYRYPDHHSHSKAGQIVGGVIAGGILGALLAAQ